MTFRLLLLPAVLLFPGFALCRPAAPCRPTPLAMLHRALLASLAVMLPAGILLTLAGVYSSSRFAAAGVLLSLLGVVHNPRLRLTLRIPWEHLALAAILVLSAILAWPATECLQGGTDAGLYQMTGIQTARTGSADTRDPFYGSMFKRARALFTIHRYGHEEKFKGFVVDPKDGSRLHPTFFRGLPVITALLYDAGGLPLALHGNLFFALLALGALYRLARLHLSPWPSLAAVLLLALNPAFVWFSRYPTAEMLLAALFVGGLAFELDGERSGRPSSSYLGAALLALSASVKFFGLLLAAPILGRLLLRDRHRTKGHLLRFHLATLLYGCLALVQIAFSGRDYFRVHLSTANVRMVAIVAPATILVVLLLRFVLKPSGLRTLLSGITALLAFYAAFVRPRHVEIGNSNNLPELVSYISPWLALLALPGLLLLLRRGSALLFPLTALAYTTALVAGTGDIPFHIFAIRRFLPISIPAACLLAIIALSRLGPGRLAGLLLLAVTIATGVFEVRALRPILAHREMAGFTKTLESISSFLRPDDLLIADGGGLAEKLAPPLQVVTGLKRVLVYRGETFEDWNALCRYVAMHRKQGRRVLWLTTERRAGRMPMVAVRKFRLPTLEIRRASLPKRIQLREGSLRLFAFRRPFRVAMTRLPFIDLGSGTELGRVSGFYRSRVARPRRRPPFTLRKSGLTAAARYRGAPNSVTLELAAKRPEATPRARVRLSWNGVFLGSIFPDRRFRRYTIRIRRQLPFVGPPPPVGILKIQTNGWRRTDFAPDASDNRPVGVEIVSIRFARHRAIFARHNRGHGRRRGHAPDLQRGGKHRKTHPGDPGARR